MQQIVLMILILACDGTSGIKRDEHVHTTHAPEAVRYTCPMHPDVVQDKPGKCPVCGMDLVPVNRESGDSSFYVMLTESQMKLANVTTAIVSNNTIQRGLWISARVVENEENVTMISSRVAGRIERLLKKETGGSIKKGEPIYTIYSETLLTLQQEFLLARKQHETLGTNDERYKSFLEAARRKLLLYGLSEHQIDQLSGSDRPQPTTTILSPATGLISDIRVAEGQYVGEGTDVMRVSDIDKLWIEGDVYANELSTVNVGDRVKVQIVGFDDEPLEKTVDFVSPSVRNTAQVTVIRATLDNPQKRYQPGMQARLQLSHSQNPVLAVPSDAVIRDENGTHVYLQRGTNTFVPRIVRTGMEDSEKVEILAGLTPGDTVAITGAYLLYSEVILKKGIDPTRVHQHTATK